MVLPVQWIPPKVKLLRKPSLPFDLKSEWIEFHLSRTAVFSTKDLRGNLAAHSHKISGKSDHKEDRPSPSGLLGTGTLTIGDGVNDEGMLQEGHIRICLIQPRSVERSGVDTHNQSGFSKVRSQTMDN
jgi:hypothetical protein